MAQRTVRDSLPVLRSAKRAPAIVRPLNNSSDVIFYCSVGERSRALALLNAALIQAWRTVAQCDASNTNPFKLNEINIFYFVK